MFKRLDETPSTPQLLFIFKLLNTDSTSPTVTGKTPYLLFAVSNAVVYSRSMIKKRVDPHFYACCEVISEVVGYILRVSYVTPGIS